MTDTRAKSGAVDMEKPDFGSDLTSYNCTVQTVHNTPTVQVYTQAIRPAAAGCNTITQTSVQAREPRVTNPK